MSISRPRLEFAAHCFLAEMRRRYTIQYPNSQNPIQGFEDYSPTDKAHIMAAIEKAIMSSDEKANPLFERWCGRRSATDEATS